jgi:hypothetical protein
VGAAAFFFTMRCGEKAPRTAAAIFDGADLRTLERRGNFKSWVFIDKILITGQSQKFIVRRKRVGRRARQTRLQRSLGKTPAHEPA